MTIKDLGLEPKNSEVKKIILKNGSYLTVKKYLPIDKKGDLLNYVVKNSIEMKTGTFSPVRVYVYFRLAVAKFYCGIDVEDGMTDLEAFDILQSNGIIDLITTNIDQFEFSQIDTLVKDTVKSIERYNTSFLGMVQAATADANGIEEQLNNILADIKSEEGQEALRLMGNMVKNG